MIIRRLTMHNFGVYASTNTMLLNGKKPVVLIGGMNGRGKTTFLEAVLLALYGSNSFTYTEDRKYSTYGQYLKSFVNMADGTKETFIEIEFELDKKGDETYQVRREWDAKGQRVRETISVKKNGEFNSFLTENWSMFIENILPSELSKFFFFDGEKIAELAVADTNEQLKESIKAMLGISVLDVLQGDLGRIISKVGKRIEGNQNFKELNKLREERDQATEKLDAIDVEITKHEEKRSKLREKLEKKSSEYKVHGGDIVEQREELMNQRSEMMANIMTAQDQLLELASGELPLELVRSLLKTAIVSGKKEQDQRMNGLAIKKIHSFYEQYLRNSKPDKSVKQFMDYVEECGADGRIPEIYKLSDITLAKLNSLERETIEAAVTKTVAIRKQRKKSQRKIEEIDSYLSVEIDEKSLNKLFREIKQIEKEIVNEEVEIEDLRVKRASANGALLSLESAYSKMAESVLSSLEDADEDERTAKYAHMAVEIIDEYRIRLQERKTDQLAATMSECYKLLANKKTLIDHVTMDSESLDLHYINQDGDEVEKKSLSAGEKQLMVISLLWALAINSKKKLPVIIDTPLSRLDSAHRSALVKKYFPKASDQTIILSTDSEIDERYYRLMEKSIGDEYTLQYNDKEKRTTIVEGYFEW